VGNLSVTKNSFFCSNSNFIYFDNYNQSRTQCNTSLITSNSVTGTATPNAEVELYYTDICNTCSPQHYFASTTANAAGNWSYTGTISGTVIANATYIGNSSDFTFAHINTDNLSVADACGGSGSITGIKVYGAANIMWIDGNRNIVGNTEELLNIKPGKYKLIISNGGCADSTMYYTINPKFTLDTTKAAISQPACADSLGSITGLSIINTDKGQISYTWTDGKGKIWSDSLTLKNVPAGTYTFVAKGKDNCTQTFGPVEMPDQNLIIMPPSVNLVKLCTIGDGVIRVNDPLAGNSYLLYDSPTASTPIDEKKSGVFQVTVTQNKTYYISSVFYNCESERVPVLVAVGLTTSAITNSFTPNGDGINDYWVIPGIETFPAAIVQIFSRNGQKVFESRGYSNTFDGTLNGKALPAGVYYYVINLTAYCKVLSGSLTIIR
jgi:gliding motility-associated-like protein